jgi:hypothetical protein
MMLPRSDNLAMRSAMMDRAPSSAVILSGAKDLALSVASFKLVSVIATPIVRFLPSYLGSAGSFSKKTGSSSCVGMTTCGNFARQIG